MSYLIYVTFSSSNNPDITLSDVLDSADSTCCNYWDDIGDAISSLIRSAECKLSRIFPEGHDYELSQIHSTSLKVAPISD